jgi:hypothetical protein
MPPPLLLLLALAAGASAAGPSAVLDADTPWVLCDTATEGGGLDPALALALRDVRRDWYGVFGIQPLVLGTYFPFTDWINQGPKRELQPPYSIPAASTTGTLVFLGGSAVLGQTLPAKAWGAVMEAVGPTPESHGCFVLPPDPGPGGHAYTAVVCTGGDELGVVFAAYELSALLGIDPQAYWTEHEPTAQTRVTITAEPPSKSGVPARVGGGPAAPAVEYRGFFVNDEDMLSGFAEDPLGKYVACPSSSNIICTSTSIAIACQSGVTHATQAVSSRSLSSLCHAFRVYSARRRAAASQVLRQV